MSKRKKGARSLVAPVLPVIVVQRVSKKIVKKCAVNSCRLLAQNVERVTFCNEAKEDSS
ncbi:hypothetical protein [Paraburkholderia sp. BCC1886]|uniref:hypothetical protein n=1 Tax=Paraburkholderia sp. BCC1886 TaxID=2562670 RepID=UPI00164326FB|nr:hypothetical protein [Paraburkholderia sp. BCC1886]